MSANTSAAIANLTSLSDQLDRTSRSLNQLSPAAAGLDSTGGTVGKVASLIGTGLADVGSAVVGMVEAVGTAAAALTTLGAVGFVGFGASSFLAAARVSELDGTLRALAQSNGLSAATLNESAHGIQSMGIEAAAARQGVALFVQNQLDLSKASALARVAQDAAVLSGQNSTETFDQMVHGIVTLNTEVIRNAGITVDVQQAQKDYAKSLGIVVTQLTPAQKEAAVLNAVLVQGQRIAGAYTTAMEEPGKVLRSFPRVINDLQVAFGERLLPAFGPIILAAFELVKSMGALSAEGKPLGIIFDAIGKALAEITAPLLGVIKGFDGWLKSLDPKAVKGITDTIASFAGVLGPILGFIITIGAKALPIVGELAGGLNPFGVALVILGTQSETFRTFLGNLFTKIKDFVQGADFQGWVNKARDTFGFLGAVFDAVISGHGDQVIAFFTDQLPEPFKNLGKALEGPVANTFGFISNLFDDIINRHGGDVIAFFKDELPQPFKDLGKSMEGPLANTFAFIGAVFDAIIAGHGDLVIKFFTDKLPDAFKGLGKALEGPVSNAFIFLGAIFDAVINGRGGLVLEFFKANLPDALQQAGKKLEGVGPILATLGGFFGGLATVILNLNSEKLAAFADTFGGTFTESFSKFGNSITPFIPVFVAIGGFAASLNNLIETIHNLGTGAKSGADAGEAVVSPLQRLVDFVRDNAGLTDFTTFLGPIGIALKAFRDNAQGIEAFFKGLSVALDSFAEAIKKLAGTEPPPWLQELIRGNVAAAAAALGNQAGGAVTNSSSTLPPEGAAAGVFHSAFIPGGVGGIGSGGGGNVFITGTINVNDGSSLDDFLNSVANAVNNATRRVNPPVPSGQPSLVGGTI